MGTIKNSREINGLCSVRCHASHYTTFAPLAPRDRTGGRLLMSSPRMSLSRKVVSYIWARARVLSGLLFRYRT
jgi:hypothetical protein